MSAPDIEPLRHVALFLHGFELGGAQLRTLALAGGLARRGLRVDLVVVASDGPLRAVVPAGVPVVALGDDLVRLPWVRAKRRRRVRAVIPRLAAWLAHERPQILMAAANHVALPAVWAHALSGRPDIGLVLRVSNYLSGKEDFRRLRRWAIHRFYRRADALIAVSNAVARDVERTDPGLGARTTVVTNPIVDDRFAIDAAPVEHPWFADGEPPVILSVGRLTEQKDFGTLLRATARILRRRQMRLVILGDGLCRPRLEALAQDLGIAENVAMPGFVDNPLPWMSAASVFVLSSAWEGLPGVLIEAMACGCPVVSTDCPGGSAEILLDGRLGPLVPVGDADAMATAILEALDAPTAAAVLRARARAFSVEAAVDAYMESFTALLGRLHGRYPF